mmetsp:Transcript_2177/g.3301  ORF Transcript_2177/g.3301 Transcript_2177/m.3301 type:complete len:267 (-) Transcript_2177:421-1221(-)
MTPTRMSIFVSSSFVFVCFTIELISRESNIAVVPVPPGRQTVNGIPFPFVSQNDTISCAMSLAPYAAIPHAPPCGTHSDFIGTGGSMSNGAVALPPSSPPKISLYLSCDISTISIPRLSALSKFPFGCFRKYRGSFFCIVHESLFMFYPLPLLRLRLIQCVLITIIVLLHAIFTSIIYFIIIIFIFIVVIVIIHLKPTTTLNFIHEIFFNFPPCQFQFNISRIDNSSNRNHGIALRSTITNNHIWKLFHRQLIQSQQFPRFIPGYI